MPKKNYDRDRLKHIVDRVNSTSNADFVKRLLDRKRKVLRDADGKAVTHKMAYVDDGQGNAIVYPEVQNIDGELVDLSGDRRAAYESAVRRGDTVHMSTSDAKLFTDSGNYKDFYPFNYSEGGGIHIDPSKKGTFTAAAKKHGKSVQAFASQVLVNKSNYSPAMVKKANFARNAAKWHAEGGDLNGENPDYEYINKATEYFLNNPSGFWSSANSEMRKWMYGHYPQFMEYAYVNTPREIRQGIDPRYLSTDLKKLAVAQGVNGAVDGMSSGALTSSANPNDNPDRSAIVEKELGELIDKYGAYADQEAPSGTVRQTTNIFLPPTDLQRLRFMREAPYLEDAYPYTREYRKRTPFYKRAITSLGKAFDLAMGDVPPVYEGTPVTHVDSSGEYHQFPDLVTPLKTIQDSEGNTTSIAENPVSSAYDTGKNILYALDFANSVVGGGRNLLRGASGVSSAAKTAGEVAMVAPEITSDAVKAARTGMGVKRGSKPISFLEKMGVSKHDRARMTQSQIDALEDVYFYNSNRKTKRLVLDPEKGLTWKKSGEMGKDDFIIDDAGDYLMSKNPGERVVDNPFGKGSFTVLDYSHTGGKPGLAKVVSKENVTVTPANSGPGRAEFMYHRDAPHTFYSVLQPDRFNALSFGLPNPMSYSDKVTAAQMLGLMKANQYSMRPGTYISGDFMQIPIGAAAMSDIDDGVRFLRKRLAGYPDMWPKSKSVGMQFPSVVDDLVNTKVGSYSRDINDASGLSPDSYATIVKMAGRKGSQLRYNDMPFLNWNDMAVDNRHIYDAFKQYEDGKISAEEYKKIFDDWITPMGGRPAEIRTLDDGNKVVVHPHPFILKRKYGGKMYAEGGNTADEIIASYLSEAGNPMSEVLSIPVERTVVNERKPVVSQASAGLPYQYPIEPPSSIDVQYLDTGEDIKFAPVELANAPKVPHTNYRKSAPAAEYIPSNELIGYLMSMEGFLERPSNKIDGKWTIGYGDTDKELNDYYLAHPDELYTKEAAEARLRNRVATEFLEYAQKYTPNWNRLTPAQKDSIISYIYNIGPGKYRKQKALLDALARLDYKGIADNINLGWNQRDKSTGRILYGIRKRRLLEQRAFRHPESAFFGQTLGAGGKIDKIMKAYSGDSSSAIDAVRKARERFLS